MAIDLVARLNLEDNMSGPLSSLNSKLAGFVGFAAITAGATSAVKTFADFDSSMRKAGAIAGASSSELKQMSEAAKQLGADTSLSASEVAEAMTEMAAKGYNATQTIDAMPGVIAAAEASGEDLAMTADVVSNALNIWSMEASESSKVADILAMAANKSAAGIGDMQYALKYAGAPAKALGMSLEEVAAAVGIMTNAGLDGSSAGTALRAGLQSLAGGAGPAKKAMKQIGFSAVDASGNMKSMQEIIASLNESMAGMNGTEKAVTVKQLVGTEAMSAFLALMEAGPAKVGELQKSLENSGGSAQVAADQMKAGIGGALEQAGGAIETFAINVGDALAPMVQKFAEFIADADTTPIVNGLTAIGDVATTIATAFINNWNPIKETVIALTAAIVAYKSAMTALTIVSTINTLMKAYRAGTLLATAAQLGFNVALLANPIGLVITAIAALVGIGVVLYRNWDKVKSSMSKVWYNMTHGKGVLLTLMGPVGQLIKFGVQLAKNWDNTKSVWQNVWTAMKTSAEDTVNTVISGINKMIGLINKLPGVNIPVVAKVDWGDTGTGVGSVSNKRGASASTGTGQLLGNHAGVSDIRGNTPRMLHDGERVLTKVENANYKRALSGDASALAKIGGAVPVDGAQPQTTAGTTNVTFNMNGITVREEADIKKIADAITTKLNQYV